MRGGLGRFSMAFLDVLSCALGGSVILAVIFSLIKDPPSALNPQAFILVTCVVEGNLQPGLELELVTPDERSFHLFQEAKPQSATGVAEKVEHWSGIDPNNPNRHIIFVKVTAPTKGTWKVRPYAVTWFDKQAEESAFVLTTFHVTTLEDNEDVLQATNNLFNQPNLSAAPSYSFQTENEGIARVKEVKIP